MKILSANTRQVFWEYLSDPGNLVRNMMWRFPRRPCDLRVIFVLGAPRSGTTLVQRILAVNPRCFTIPGETALFTRRNLFTQPKRFDLSERQTAVLYRDSSDVVNLLENAVAVLTQADPARDIFIEKTPQHVFHIPFIRKYFPNGRIINMVRDGRDCFCSAQSHTWIPQRSSVWEFARYWRSCIRAADRAGDEEMMSVRYEDLTAEPERTVRQMMEFVDLPFDARQLEASAIGDDRRSEADVFRRLKEPVDKASCERWRAELSPRQVATFNQIASAELSAWGYPLQ